MCKFEEGFTFPGTVKVLDDTDGTDATKDPLKTFNQTFQKNFSLWM
jgi:hypothetical protein